MPNRFWTLLVLLCGSSLCPSIAWSQPIRPGSEPFVTTRLEWMEVYLNAGKGVAYSDEHGYSITYVADLNNDALIIVAQFNPKVVDEEVMETAIASAKGIVALYAKRKRWDDWLVVKELREPLRALRVNQVQPNAGEAPDDKQKPTAP